MMVEYGLHEMTATDVELLVKRFCGKSRENRISLYQFRNGLTPVL
jgi:hypothetical protein